MSWLDDTLENLMLDVGKDGHFAWSATRTAKKLIAQHSNRKQEIVDQLLNLIEQSKEKSLPLTWLAGEIKKL